MKYNPHKVESKWQSIWPKERESYKFNPGENKYYVLDMFSYPSSEGLHMGHWLPFTVADVWARYQTMLGNKVLFPVGFDSFGLPAENAAIKSNTHPAEYTEKAIANFKRQLQTMGSMRDWSTEVITSDPSYYKWTQWLFLQLYKNGLAYRKDAPVNWCPKDQTVLANEQVINGKCERCGTQVIRKQLKQWFFKITDFAEELLSFEGLEWPERVKLLQTSWIGKSEGAEIHFGLEAGQNLTVFTTRPDTLFGVTYLIVAPEYPILLELTTPDHKVQVETYVARAIKENEIDRLADDRAKTGVFIGSYAVHPLTKEKLPIWVADYVIGTYGTGAVMGVPAHDTRDFAFATQYKLPIRYVISPIDSPLDTTQAYLGDGTCIESDEFSNQPNYEAGQMIVAKLAEHKLGSTKVQYRLRDWLVSRQRYWGAPIPIIYCEKCGEQHVPESDLPVELPVDVDFLPSGGSPLERHPSFKKVQCPNCGGEATRETDTLDTFVDSSWYFLRYTDPKNSNQAFSPDQVKTWLPVDFYIGGIEHAILHLLYARFMMRSLHKLGYVPCPEPFQIFFGNGMVYLHGSKMSKSKGNIINPDDMVKKHGTDALRGFILFMGPAGQDVEWQENGIMGVKRFLERSWQIFNRFKPDDIEKETASPDIIQAVNDITEHLLHFRFNLCISSLMIALNKIENGMSLNHASLEMLCKLYAPFFPHFAEEVWHTVLSKDNSVFNEAWPEKTDIQRLKVTYPIQVNGKTRKIFEFNVNDREEIVVAKARELVASFLTGKIELKTVFVPGRIVNFVVK